MQPRPKLDAWVRKSTPNNPWLRNGPPPAWFTWSGKYRKFPKLISRFKWSLIHNILSHYYDTVVAGISVEIHKFKKQLSHLVAKKVCQLWFCTRPYWAKYMTREERNGVTDSGLLSILLHLGDNVKITSVVLTPFRFTIFCSWTAESHIW